MMKKICAILFLSALTLAISNMADALPAYLVSTYISKRIDVSGELI
jgi:hypothetical protein